jgi:hypothetical protein
MGAADDVYKLVQKFTMLGVECLITRWFRQNTTPGGAAAVLSAWVSDKLPAILAVVSDQVTAVGTEVTNIYDNADFAISSGSQGVGAFTAEALPAYMAIGLEFPSPNKSIRASTMRLPGVTEGVLTDGVITAGAVAQYDDCAEELASSLDHATSTYSPILYTEGNARTGYTEYITYITNGYFSRVTTQNSRKS